MSNSAALINNYLMFDTSVKSSDKLVIGDCLMGSDSLPKEIKNIEKLDAQVLKVEPLNSESFYVLADSELTLMATNMEKVYWEDKRKRVSVTYLTSEGIKYKIIKTDSEKEKMISEGKKILAECQLLPTYIKYKDICEINAGKFLKWCGLWQSSFKISVKGIDFPSKAVKLEPYAVGYWLGDGVSADSIIITADEEIIKYYDDYAEKLGLSLTKRPDIYRYRITTATDFGGKGRNAFRQGLCDYHLLNNKHIPLDYLCNSRQNRLELLAGIIDSDGCLHCNTYAITFKSQKLSEDTVFLARSLGFAVHGGARPIKATCTNAPGGPKEGDYYRFIICGDGIDEIPCIVGRKKIVKGEKVNKRSSTVSGFKIMDMGIQSFYKLTLSSPSRVLLRDLTIVKI